MNSRIKYLVFIVLAIVLLALIGGYLLGQKAGKFFTPEPSPQPNEPTQSFQTSNIISYKCQKGETAFERLEKEKDIKYEESSFGKFITSIDSIEQGGGKYWLYTVDGKEATVSADQYKCLNEEEVRWELK